MERSPLDDLRAALEALPPGPIPGQSRGNIERLLAAAWDEHLRGTYGGMQGYKLIGRTEGMSWQPPTLRFAIERHGATVAGSIYAHVQHWTVDVRSGIAELEPYAPKRRLYPAAPRLDTAPIARPLADAMRAGLDDPRLEWRQDRRRVRVRLDECIGRGIPKETRQGRAKRLRRDLLVLLVPDGWSLAGKG